MSVVTTTSGATDDLIDLVADFRTDAVPSDVRRECTRAFVNAMGCMIAGGGHEMVEAASNGLAVFAGPPSASLIGRGQKADVLTASLLNGLAGAAYSFDDAYSEALLHPSGPAVAALLAMAETRPLAGADFLACLALGMEISCRLADVIASSRDRSWIAWSQTGICCGAGVALAAGKALGLARDQLDWALGIALSQAAGTRATHGSMSASLIFGHAASTGLRAAILAQQGFTASSGSVEDRYGFASVYAKEADLSLLTKDFGLAWQLKANTYKPFPCALLIHASLDGLLQLKRENAFPHEHVESISLSVPPAAITLCSRPHPMNEMEAKLSLEHWIAAAAVYGKAGIAQGSLSVVNDPRVVNLRERIRLEGDAGVESDAARITIALSGGETLQRTIDHCVGGVGRPMSDHQLEEKFLDLSSTSIGPERARQVLDLCWSVNEARDVGAAARAAC
ncbi:MmgE/PrpD family protein [Sinorhizobium meliloti]|uniref:MmgE/PrpD family protein n=1 Tax=Rhizobium meliloti TaxID=382 RepID=UPI0018E8A203|nr:MmgE/PrpD family protein [Sinorhizobium meliloti]QQF06177.1 MmgE/PrpD family protein [Sinorhizobium meliloti]